MVLNLLVWGVFFIGRCLCCCMRKKCICRCCSSKPKEKVKACKVEKEVPLNSTANNRYSSLRSWQGYKLGKQVRIPIFFYIFFFACIVAAAFVAYTGDQDTGKAVNDLFGHSREGLSDLQTFLGNANTPVVNIGGLVNDAADASLSILDGTDYVEYGMDNVKARLTAFTTVYDGGIQKAGAQAQVDSTVSILDASIDPVVKDIKTVLDTLRTSLVEGKQDMQEALDDASIQIVDLNATVTQMYDNVDEFDKTAEDSKSSRTAAVLSIFALSIACSALGFLGIISYVMPYKKGDILVYLLNITW